MKHRKAPRATTAADKDEEIVRLEDLTPREDAKGGQKQLFGEQPRRRPGRRRDAR